MASSMDLATILLIVAQARNGKASKAAMMMMMRCY